MKGRTWVRLVIAASLCALGSAAVAVVLLFDESYRLWVVFALLALVFASAAVWLIERR